MRKISSHPCRELHYTFPRIKDEGTELPGSPGKVITNAAARSVRPDGMEVIVNVETRSQTRELRARKLLVATGRSPNSDRIAIEKAGVELGNEGQVRVNEFLHTNVPHIFAGGREVGSQMATPVCSQDGGIAAHTAFTRDRQLAHCRRLLSEVRPDYNKRVLSKRWSAIVCTFRVKPLIGAALNQAISLERRDNSSKEKTVQDTENE